MINLTVPIYYTIKRKSKKDKTFLIGMNWYRNVFYRINNKVKADYRDIVAKQVKNQIAVLGKVHVNYIIYLKRKGSDGGNVRSVIEKYVLDALVKEKMIEEDNALIVVSDNSKYLFDKNNPRAEIQIVKI